uniref:Reverse transcriptase domain-containing protein n=1 Tax=Tanacetum cinerariifolium TaxID=118510 RepID=A0A6L2JJV3_TANCI|nr:hypothetical protein [Tanacetum cinerariifolium]
MPLERARNFKSDECPSCGALYTTDYCCSDGSLVDKIICDLNKTPDLFQEPPQNCVKCGNPIDGHYCQGCALLRKKFKDLFTYCIENGIFQDFQDTPEPSNDNTNVVNALQEPFVVKQDPGKNSSQGAHYGYNCPPKVSIIPNSESCNNQTVDELPQTLPSFDPTCYSGDGNSFTYDSKSNIVDDSPNPFQYSVVHQPPQEEISVEFLQEKRKQINSVQTFLRKFNRISFYEMPKVLSLAWETILEIKHAFKDKHCQPEDILELFQRLHNDVQNIHEELEVYINTPSWDCPAICYNDDDGEDYEFIKSSVENLIPNPCESEDLSDSECDVPACDDFTTFSNLLFDTDNDFSSSDDESFSDEDISKKIYSNPLFDEEIISIKIDPHHFNEEIRLIEKLLYDNSSPRPPKEFLSENSDAIIESFSPSPIPVEDSDPFMKEIDLFLASDGSIPPGIDSDYLDSKGDNLFLKRLLHDDPIPLPNTLDFSNVVRVFLPFFTYPVTSSILLFPGSEDIIFDPDISNYHFSSLESGVSHRSGNFMKFNVYPNYLNESPMEILSSTCFPMNQ